MPQSRGRPSGRPVALIFSALSATRSAPHRRRARRAAGHAGAAHAGRRMPYIVGMDVVTGTDTSASSGGHRPPARRHSPPDGARRRRRQRRRACSARSRASCCRCPGADEVHIHHLVADGETRARSSWPCTCPAASAGSATCCRAPSARPAWAGSRTPAAASSPPTPQELAASVPRLAETGRVTCALLVPLAERGEVEAVVRARAPRAQPPSRHAEVELAAALVEQAATALALARARAEAGTDAVTGCMNHRAMRRRLDEEIGRATRTGGPLSALLIDLDDFKLVNDRHGHQAGDAMLRSVVHALVGRVPRVRPRRALRRRRVRRDPAQRRPRQRRRRGEPCARAPARDPRARRSRRRRRVGFDRRGAVAGADEHRRAARSLRRRAAALQAPGQGARDARPAS